MSENPYWDFTGDTAWQCTALDKCLVIDRNSSQQTGPIALIRNKKWLFIKTLHSVRNQSPTSSKNVSVGKAARVVTMIL